MRMDHTTLAISLARARIAVGIAAIAAPRLAVRVLSDGTDHGRLAPALVRMVGARDVALGLGTVVAIDHGAPVRGWLEGSALTDAADCATGFLARRHLSGPAFRVATGLGGASAALGLYLSRRLDPPPPAHPRQPEAVVTGHTEPAA